MSGPILRIMKIDALSSSPATLAVQREIAVMKKQQDVAKETGQALVDLVKHATPPGRVDTHA